VFPGRIIADRYRVIRVLGRGGMGVVSEAERMDTGERFALKFLREDIESDLQPNARFTREARLATRLSSAHACKMFGVGEWELGPFIVMELLDGRPLNAVLEPGRPMPWPHAVRIAYEACQALGEAHALGIVHRDVKPGNVFLTWTAEGHATTKILDFGVAKIPTNVVTLGGEASLTDATLLLGTPAYVAPEQLTNSKLVDARADIWALGVMLYEMLAGRLPFQSPLVPKLLVMIARDEPPALATLMPNLPAQLVQIVHRCLFKDPSLRFESATALADDLLPFLNREASLLEPLLRAASLRPIKLASSIPPDIHLHEDDSLSDLPVARERPDSLGPHTTARAGRVAPVPGKPAIRHWRSAAFCCVAIAASYGVALRLLPRSNSTQSQHQVTVPKENDTTERSITISADPNPSDLQLLLDGGLLDANPVTISLALDTRAHVVRAMASGFVPAEHRFVTENTTSISLHLVPLPPPKSQSVAKTQLRHTPTTAARTPAAASTQAQSPAAVSRQLDANNPF